MARYDHPALVLGGADHRTNAERLADRIRTVLETQPGSLPFSPTFGCDLSGLVGGTASQSRLSEARMRVTSALNKWIPGVQIKTVVVELVEPARPGRRGAGVPIAEAAMASRVVSQALEIRIEVETPEGLVSFEATLASDPSTGAP
ncbi:MAG: hypothetical protein KC656_10805 [Myxococcales bacterium]|nr:hypothetical protein [Myxococcales bacterium]MCB9670649.1 hypothetical protein [Alphaproteobacteria bacterium]MCB9693789.1 hypothetical protein [Alphaproteobacteria bacterium]